MATRGIKLGSKQSEYHKRRIREGRAAAAERRAAAQRETALTLLAALKPVAPEENK